MSTKPTKTEFPAGDFISENAVRAVFGRRRPTTPTTPARANGPHSSAAGHDTTTPAGQTRHLRRWSVAELIARAIAPPPTTT
jgi:hypothetical protein